MAESITLQPGTLIDRFGNPMGTYTAAAGAPFNTRGLPAGAYDTPYNAYQVASPVTVQQSYVMSWFGSTTGMQFQLPQSVNSLLEQRILAPVSLPKPPLK
ncbi:TNT domain-containing protein [Paraburkholderia sartisoli]|uniref:TNT domain-containing protein n=1 Tax=Paraburkholderia sartisoli TaxID=83784 RepID=UPI00116030AF